MLDVDDDVGVVEQCPAALAGAFTADRLVSPLRGGRSSMFSTIELT